MGSWAPFHFPVPPERPVARREKAITYAALDAPVAFVDHKRCVRQGTMSAGRPSDGFSFTNNTAHLQCLDAARFSWEPVGADRAV